MRESENTGQGSGSTAYRIIVEGELDDARAAWFGAATLVAAEGRTTMELAITDQADLHGLLRRVRDMNLRIVELSRITTNTSAGE